MLICMVYVVIVFHDSTRVVPMIAQTTQEGQMAEPYCLMERNRTQKMQVEILLAFINWLLFHMVITYRKPNVYTLDY